ncbi:MAG: hypothetical protein ACRYF9_15820 [Janthinobacterium lividum]|uniref:hypothetical protein n=1 Tax=Pseudomonas TaxID=286 RepID=UPI001CF94339|nr:MULTISPECIES: hypothetical protein [Pseudomonas]
MVDSHLKAMEPELCERLIDRLGLALDVARTAVRLRNEEPRELELRGLSRAEFDWINAYLQLSGTGVHADCADIDPVPVQRTANVVWLKDKRKRKAPPRTRVF